MNIRDEFRAYLNESDDVKAKRLECIEISSSRTQKIEDIQFHFKFMEYRLQKAEYPVHPSAKLVDKCELIIKTVKGALETTFIYDCDIIDYLDNEGKSSTSFEMKDLKTFEAFINDESVKLDKGTAKKISSNFKIDTKEVKKIFMAEFDRLKHTNYTKIKSELDDINYSNREFAKFKELMDKSSEISKIVKKYEHPVQKIVFYKDILVLTDGYLNEKMRKDIKRELDSYDTELWSINDTVRRRKAEETNQDVIKNLRKICTGKLVYMSRGQEVKLEI